MEHARAAFNSWMPGTHLVPDIYWKSEHPSVIAMEYISGKNGTKVDMGTWGRRQKTGFVRRMAVIGICLIWKAQYTTSKATTREMVGRGLKDKSADAYDREEIDKYFGIALSGVWAPRKPSLKNFKYLRPCDISLRGSKIVAITSWESTVNQRDRGIDQGIVESFCPAFRDKTATPKHKIPGELDWDIIREYGGGIREDDFLEELVDDESNEGDEDEGKKEAVKLAEDWYHEPVWQLVSECVRRREIRADTIPIGEYLRWTKSGSGECLPDGESEAGYVY
ncbi:hypothetical protein L873DRAFT_1842184 [Choiromyces venosus 120613-1]|uniref:Protein kinase domain-containing protein n=1 Tax=Choiromyces venosus 120613-1 TaxID=1336337 RepID=A0A3N4K720_9PEZI|nr:hypothetical protein L873DRAFT_1842184 [Choiromyces venosus 120613-1]